MAEIPSLPELEFDEGSHVYRIGSEILPSVTTLMKPLSADFYKHIPDHILDKAADRGTSVHNGIENWIKFGIEDIPGEFQGYFTAFRDWWEKYSPAVIGSELRLYHKLLRYAGTADLVCNIAGELWLIDYKTTSTLSRRLLRVQLEAYAKALESHGFRVAHKGALHLKKDGSYEFVGFPAGDGPAWRVFGSLKTIYDFNQSEK